jgi:plasmid stabilization system protein ParE
MPRVELTHGANNDLEKIFDHLAAFNATKAAASIADIRHAFAILSLSPMIGRLIYGDLRELLIGRRKQAYVAKYRYVPGSELVLILSIRSQRQQKPP